MTAESEFLHHADIFNSILTIVILSGHTHSWLNSEYSYSYCI